ncbi:MAG: YcaO-like family protein [Schlesneria sp.]
MVANTSQGNRCRQPEITLKHAMRVAADAGINEATEITHRDCLGVPVFTTERKKAHDTIVSYGKGLNCIDAAVGAYMEAIEYYFCEPGIGSVETHWGTARNVAGYSEAEDSILDFAPLLRREVSLDAPLLLASVEDIETGEICSLPAELIDFPARDTGQFLFGTSTNGVASGNSLVEASIHALLELIERDIWSFECIHSTSILVEPNSLPDEVNEIVDRAQRNGLGLIIRSIFNDFGLPFFAAFIFDINQPRRISFNGGWACDLNRHRALVRAVTEAAQSRLAFMPGGGRENSRVAHQAAESQELEASLVRKHIVGVSDTHGKVTFGDIPDLDVPASLIQQMEIVKECVRRVSPKPIYRAVYTPPDAALHVVRMVVPLLENMTEFDVRVGPRLKAAIDDRSSKSG